MAFSSSDGMRPFQSNGQTSRPTSSSTSKLDVGASTPFADWHSAHDAAQSTRRKTAYHHITDLAALPICAGTSRRRAGHPDRAGRTQRGHLSRGVPCRVHAVGRQPHALRPGRHAVAHRPDRHAAGHRHHEQRHCLRTVHLQRLRLWGTRGRQAVGQGQPHVHRKAAGGHDWHVRGMLRHQLPRRQQPPVRHQGHHVLPDDDGRRGPPGGRRRPHRCQREPAQPERAVRAPGRRRRRWRQVTNRIRASLASQTTHTHDTHRPTHACTHRSRVRSTKRAGPRSRPARPTTGCRTMRPRTSSWSA